MKLFLCSILLLFFVSFTTDNNNDDEIIWNENYKLKWEDFKGNPKYNTVEAAATSDALLSSYSINNQSGNFTVKCVFIKSESWVKIPSNRLLNHEQRHFDITEIYARKLRKKFKQSVFNSSAQLKSFYDSETQNNESAWNNYQALYDKETKHSENDVKQAEWDNKIDNELKELEAYKDTLVVCPIKE